MLRVGGGYIIVGYIATVGIAFTSWQNISRRVIVAVNVYKSSWFTQGAIVILVEGDMIKDVIITFEIWQWRYENLWHQ